MPEIIPNYTTEQKFVTVANNDGNLNTEITTQAADSWFVENYILSGTDILILFTRTVPTEALP